MLHLSPPFTLPLIYLINVLMNSLNRVLEDHLIYSLLLIIILFPLIPLIIILGQIIFIIIRQIKVLSLLFLDFKVDFRLLIFINLRIIYFLDFLLLF